MQSSSPRLDLGETDQRTDLKMAASFENEFSQKAVVCSSGTISQNSEWERKIADLVGVYSLEVCERIIVDSADGYPSYRDCLDGCLRFHAERTPQGLLAEIGTLIRPLQEGRSPSDGAAMGGNPLRDCVLAVAMLLNESKAVGVFEDDYSAYLRGVAYKVRSNFGNDPAEWWDEFLDFLAGYTHVNGKLKKYQGKSALRFWLRVVLWNFLRRRPIPGAATELTESTPMAAPETDELALDDSLRVFTKLVRDSLATMRDKDRLLLSMIYIDNLLKKDIAGVFQVHPGQVGRWQEAALDHFRKTLFSLLERLPRKELYEEIMGGIVNNPKEFSEALADALQKLRGDESDR